MISKATTKPTSKWQIQYMTIKQSSMNKKRKTGEMGRNISELCKVFSWQIGHFVLATICVCNVDIVNFYVCIRFHINTFTSVQSLWFQRIATRFQIYWHRSTEWLTVRLCAHDRGTSINMAYLRKVQWSKTNCPATNNNNVMKNSLQFALCHIKISIIVWFEFSIVWILCVHTWGYEVA